jgi:hypothetical protein
MRMDKKHAQSANKDHKLFKRLHHTLLRFTIKGAPPRSQFEISFFWQRISKQKRSSLWLFLNLVIEKKAISILFNGKHLLKGNCSATVW